tara:strand:+ start:170 stop:379 length:210 start_codon:yes stop_codon:yes gene_type:complete
LPAALIPFRFFCLETKERNKEKFKAEFPSEKSYARLLQRKQTPNSLRRSSNMLAYTNQRLKAFAAFWPA